MCFVGLAVTYDTNINLPQVLGGGRGVGGLGGEEEEESGWGRWDNNSILKDCYDQYVILGGEGCWLSPRSKGGPRTPPLDWQLLMELAVIRGRQPALPSASPPHPASIVSTAEAGTELTSLISRTRRRSLPPKKEEVKRKGEGEVRGDAQRSHRVFLLARESIWRLRGGGCNGERVSAASTWSCSKVATDGPGCRHRRHS